VKAFSRSKKRVLRWVSDKLFPTQLVGRLIQASTTNSVFFLKNREIKVVLGVSVFYSLWAGLDAKKAPAFEVNYYVEFD